MALAFLKDFPELVKSVPAAMKFGLVTYQWGSDWDLPTLIANCEAAGYTGVELRTEHAHKVEINLTADRCAEVNKRFAYSSVVCIGYGSNFEFHSPDPEQLRKNIEGTKEYIKLCKDIGATGIKVKPNYMPPEVPKEKTICSTMNEMAPSRTDDSLENITLDEVKERVKERAGFGTGFGDKAGEVVDAYASMQGHSQPLNRLRYGPL